jgi:hypothetical protein
VTSHFASSAAQNAKNRMLIGFTSQTDSRFSASTREGGGASQESLEEADEENNIRVLYGGHDKKDRGLAVETLKLDSPFVEEDDLDISATDCTCTTFAYRYSPPSPLADSGSNSVRKIYVIYILRH